MSKSENEKIISAIDALPPLRQTVEENNLWANKKLGQNFLFDLNITKKIARAAEIPDGANVIEIGPGPGGLTRALLTETNAHVTAIEQDERFIDALQPLVEASQGRLTLIKADAMKTDLTKLVAGPRHIAANLPYNIATPLLTGWLETHTEFAGMTLMFQKEVADRILAKPDTNDYGRLSVLCQWLCRTGVAMELPPSAFTPPPKVKSSVVRLVPRTEPLTVSVKTVEAVTAAGFGQRRKMLRQSLKTPGVDLPALFAATGIAETARAETLSVADFIRMAEFIEKNG